MIKVFVGIRYQGKKERGEKVFVQFNWGWPPHGSCIVLVCKESLVKKGALDGWAEDPDCKSTSFRGEPQGCVRCTFLPPSIYFLLLLPPSWLARSPYMDLLVSWKHTNRWGRWRGLPSILGLHLTPLPPTCHWRSSLRLYKHTWLNIQKRFLNWIFFLSLAFFLSISQRTNHHSWWLTIPAFVELQRMRSNSKAVKSPSYWRSSKTKRRAV